MITTELHTTYKQKMRLSAYRNRKCSLKQHREKIVVSDSIICDYLSVSRDAIIGTWSLIKGTGPAKTISDSATTTPVTSTQGRPMAQKQ